ncbi:unnamed protein product [Arabis nemorensis]|uniref:PIPK domain-containing protein n=1 Tax=Arabis nemorensis TaxID=586526 RepID=A0A565C9F4_9BRAS|nr:unnamed protein product [Arabis nemorensis]
MESSSSGTVDFKLAMPPMKVNPCEDVVGVPSSGNDEQDTSALFNVQLIETEAYANEFADLRSFCNLAEISFLNSLKSLDTAWKAKGGKSGASFAKTRDNRFILKEISAMEYNSFVDNIAPKYFDYIKSTNETCLAKIFGFYEVRDELRKQYVLVMENVLYGKDIEVLYDLKGKLERNLNLSDATHVRIEEEFMEDVKNEALYISQPSKETLQAAVNRDANFLKEVNIMDYSLLVGVDKTNHELVCGIIDYLVPYSALKKFEWFAKSCVMSLTCNNQEPTVLHPNAYMRRFTNFVEREFKCNHA